ncbi:MAG: MFS transporter [Bacteroidetes bacterium]|jgi:maltose/moltooligosaccharide transporter|nr:MFS transporter [Bacteroidota bacterium]MBT3747940.1 MFS transporter [Bacteroidota bacterium]MBT4400549.1 MFS transporter [Bacteroidota bacterium]MBT4411054.1 MFS transporter [Bacteroidota bacterium]MBT5424738.1 MFS transporter [Bacteroidota bacterium]
MKTQPRLSFWQIWNMSFGFLGIQMGFALQNANVSRIFETLGASIENIPILWIAAPVTGLIVQPIIGHYSDKTWTRLGRRRPYFLGGAILASVALIFMPNSPVLWIAAGMLWIMDASINISMEPFRAFVGDNLPSEQRTKGFAMQSFFIGTGAVVASLLPYIFTNWFGIDNTAEEGVIPPSVKWAFYVGAAVFITTVLWTVFKSKEYTPEELASFGKTDETENGHKKQTGLHEPGIPSGKFMKSGLIWSFAGLIIAAMIYLLNLEKELYILGFGLLLYGILQVISGLFVTRNKSNGLTEILTDLRKMPDTMRQLAIVQFFSWLALFSMWIYTTSAITGHVYGTTDTTSVAYNDGADWVGVLFGVYNGAAALFAFLLPVLAKLTSRKMTHSISLIAGALGLCSIILIKDPNLLIIPFIGIGLAWASILSMPYAILTGSLPQTKMGVYMGIFNFFIVIPQILAATILGFLTVNVFGGNAIYALIFGGGSMMIAAITVFFVKDPDDKK